MFSVPGVFKELHERLHEFAKTLQFKENRKRYKILYKAGFLLLFDIELNKTIASFEYLKRDEYPLRERERARSGSDERRETKTSKKEIRPSWTDDPQVPDVILQITEGYERGHIATYSNHKAKKETRYESCHHTNGFPQITNFHAYRQVEEWARQIFWKCNEAVVITFLQYKQNGRPSSVFKILKRKCDSGHVKSVMTIFQFPNIKKDSTRKYNKQKHKGQKEDSSFHYLRSVEDLNHLPFSFTLKNHGKAYVHGDMITGRNWKSALENVVKKHRKSQDTTLVIEPKPPKKDTAPSRIIKYLINTGIVIALVFLFLYIFITVLLFLRAWILKI